MFHLLIVLSLFITTQSLTQENNEHQKRILVEQIVLQTIINQKTNHDTTTPKFGDALRHYLNNLDNKTFKDTFLGLPFRAKIMYMLTMHILEYELFLERFDLAEWQTFWTKLTPEEQKHIPKTKEEQIGMLRNTYHAYCKYMCGWFSSVEKKSPYPSDLKKFKQKCYKDPHSKDEHINSYRCMERDNFLRAYLTKERYILFNL